MLEMEPWSSDLQLTVNKEGFRNTCASSCRYLQVLSPWQIIPAGGWTSEGEMKSVSMLPRWSPWYEPQHRQLLPEVCYGPPAQRQVHKCQAESQGTHIACACRVLAMLLQLARAAGVSVFAEKLRAASPSRALIFTCLGTLQAQDRAHICKASVQELPAQPVMAVAVFIGSLGSLPEWRFQFIYSNTVTKGRAAAHQAQGHLQCCHSRRAILAGPAPGHVPGSLWVQHAWPQSEMSCTGHNCASVAMSLSESLLTKPWLICPTCHVGFLTEQTSDASFYLSLENWSGFFFCLLSKGPS